MAVSYTWNIETLFTKDITESGTTYNDVIKRVLGNLTATSSETSNTAVHGFDLDLKNPADWSTFTAYDSVSKANVQTWIENRIGDAAISQIKQDLVNYLAFEDEIDGSTAKGTGSGDSFSATFPWS
jgi:hypothetical protein|tara:strand:+ start:35 stop:412 length:378 start_codon:yes stop_codon:yes gene_type:complete